MKTYTKSLLAMLAVLLGSICFVGTASATVLEMNTLYAGEYPAAPISGPGTPWLTATLSYGGPSATQGLYDYTLTMQSYLSNNEFIGGANKNIGWAFSLANIPYSMAFASGTAANSTRTSGILTGSVPGTYNLAFYWKANTFTTDSYAVYAIETSTAPTSSFFKMTGLDGLYSAAHIQGITGTNQTCSVWIVNGGTSGFTPSLTSCGATNVSVPEPSELPLYALGLVLVLTGWYAARRRRQ
ncbi:PEP-CTERM sorting domain-containing protein [Dyella sp. A6]|uniref:PEP-CTERM sorting domain-containing protein n=1 Tax=Dyella aluminiiresistens TaxID=3069105 RepID=UPI002E7AAA14|nr:PEP-CTERM sorting domain-containing protein [Dyella sp. A6]